MLPIISQATTVSVRLIGERGVMLAPVLHLISVQYILDVHFSYMPHLRL